MMTPAVPDGAIPIVDREAYYAYPDGRIYSTVTGKYLKPHPTGKDGRFHVKLPRLNRKPGESSLKQVDVGSLICTAFHGERPTGTTVSHLNGNCQDNRAENLAWETLKDNLARRREHGTLDDGFNNSRSVFSPKDIACILAWSEQGVTQRAIAEALGVSRRTVGNVVNGKRYTNEAEYDGEIPEWPSTKEKDLRAKLTKDQVISIRNDVRTNRVIAAEFGIDESQVSTIKRRISWPHVKDK